MANFNNYLLITICLIAQGCEKNNSVDSLYNHLQKNNRYEMFKEVLLTERSNYNVFLFHHKKYNLEYWLKFSGNEIIVEEESIIKNDSLLNKKFAQKFQSIKRELTNLIEETIVLIEQFNVVNINSNQFDKNKYSIRFLFKSGKSLEYWDSIELKKLKELRKSFEVQLIDDNWFIISPIED